MRWLVRILFDLEMPRVSILGWYFYFRQSRVSSVNFHDSDFRKFVNISWLIFSAFRKLQICKTPEIFTFYSWYRRLLLMLGVLLTLAVIDDARMIIDTGDYYWQWGLLPILEFIADGIECFCWCWVIADAGAHSRCRRLLLTLGTIVDSGGYWWCWSNWYRELLLI